MAAVEIGKKRGRRNPDPTSSPVEQDRGDIFKSTEATNSSVDDREVKPTSDGAAAARIEIRGALSTSALFNRNIVELSLLIRVVCPSALNL